ncbi:mobilization protein [Phocaeicola dorei]|uniref:mobilization protein n=1 Tax=Phocaeicola dorei TaxID=357276 RepID=UPI0032EB7C0D
MFASPTTVVKEQASRVIEVVRGVEKTTNVRLKNIEQALSRLVSSQQTVNEYTPPEQNPDEFLHISQVQELLERAKEQERTIAKYRDEVSRLQGELEVSASKKTEVQSPVNLNKLLEVVERIDSMKKIPTFNDTVYEIDRNSFDLWIKRFKDELKQ